MIQTGALLAVASIWFGGYIEVLFGPLKKPLAYRSSGPSDSNLFVIREKEVEKCSSMDCIYPD